MYNNVESITKVLISKNPFVLREIKPSIREFFLWIKSLYSL